MKGCLKHYSLRKVAGKFFGFVYFVVLFFVVQAP